MKSLRSVAWAFASVVFAAAMTARATEGRTVAGLVWETVELQRELPAGTAGVEFVFTATNRGSKPEQIREVLTSCECLTAHAPEQPWVVAPGKSVRLEARLDLTDRTGEVRQEIWVTTTQGRATLVVRAVLPRRGAGSR